MWPTKTNTVTGLEVALTGETETISIDLSQTTLTFTVPVRTLENSQFVRQMPRDLRPFVNTVSRTEYRYHPTTKRGYCTFFESGWWLHSKNRWKRQNLGIVRLICSLEAMRDDESATFPNLFAETCLEDWLSRYYRDREEIVDRARFKKHENGSLEIEFLDADSVPSISPDQVPLQKLPELVAGMPCYFIYLNSGVVEFNLPITKRDVLQLHFKLRPKTEDGAIRSQLSRETLGLAHQILSTVNIQLSDRSEHDLREAKKMSVNVGGLLEN